MDQLTQMFGPFVALVIVGVSIVWSVLLFFLPFFVYGASRRARECSEKLDRLIAIQDRAHPAPQAPNQQAAVQKDGWS